MQASHEKIQAPYGKIQASHGDILLCSVAG